MTTEKLRIKLITMRTDAEANGDDFIFNLVNFIIADRRRVVEPLVRLKQSDVTDDGYAEDMINETLKLAGIE